MKDNVINFPKRDLEDEQLKSLQNVIDRYEIEVMEHQKTDKLEYCVKEPVSIGLKASLKKVKKEFLEWMLLTIIDPEITMNKADLVEAVYENLCNESHLLLLISLMTDKEYDFFLQLLKVKLIKSNELLIRDTHFLLESGLVFSYYSEDTFIYTIAKEVKKIVNEFDLEMLLEMRLQYQRLVCFLEATVNLYGAIPFQNAVEIFDSIQVFSGEDNGNYLEDLINVFLIRDQSFDLIDEILVSDYFYDQRDAKVQLLLETILMNDKPYYIPPYEIYMKYADDFYVEKNSAYRALEKFVGNKWTPDPVERLDLMGAMKYEAEHGNPKNIIDLLSTEEFFFNNQKELNHFLELYMEFCNSTRMWVNHGHTPNELSDITSGRVHTATRLNKINRNDLCPCGSGKKYKHCCGK